MPEPRLKIRYREEIIPAMMKRFNYTNRNQVPRLKKVVLNMGIGEAARDIKLLDSAERELTLIAGQKAVLTRARRAISAFKIRAGMPVGCFVTLRGRRMYDFLDRLINIAIPRVRDFRGLPAKSFDGRGSHSMGIREHLIFMELDYNKVSTVRGMNITTVTTAKTDEEARELLRLFGMPFREG
ncbi:MAG: 50S ribosomal protein L5 [Candidatus Sumerlaeia bacterium]|nr:50S ribosomal protein L5 [Candidatus Sumerlaeia bacterium]